MDGTKSQKDGTQKQAGPRPQSVAAQTLAGSKGTSSAQPPETYTKEQVDKMISDAVAIGGRDAKALDLTRQQLEARKAELEKRETDLSSWQKRKEEEELEAARGDPVALSNFQRKKGLDDRESGLTKRERELQRKELEHEEAVKVADEINKTMCAAEVAVEYDVEIGPLLELSDGSLESMKKVAAVLPKKQANPDKSGLVPDAGVTIGGKNIANMTADDKLKAGFRKYKK